MNGSIPVFPVLHYLPECISSCLLSQWCRPIISSSVTHFPSCLQSFPASRSFPMSQVFALGGQNIGPSASASVLPMNIQISFKIDWFDLLPVQGTLMSLLQHHSWKASILWCSAFFMVQLSHLYITTGKTITLTVQTFVSKVTDYCLSVSDFCLLFNMLSKFVIPFLSRSIF